MTYLVTGGAGFIGSHIASHLCSKGAKVTILDNFSTGKLDNLEGLRVRLVDGDIRDPAAVAEATKGVDTVFHQAALCSVSRSMKEPAPTHDNNVTGTLTMLEGCRKASVRRFVMASSSSVYGDSRTSPKHERLQPHPLSPYAASKLMGELYCQLYWKAYGLETVALRYFNVFGPRQDPESEYAAVIPRFIQATLNGHRPQIYGDGSQTRDFTFVRDVVSANMAAAESSRAAGQVMNVACGERWSLLELLDRLQLILDNRLEPEFQSRRAGDVLHSRADISKARRMIGFNPQTPFEEGLGITAEWYARQVFDEQPGMLRPAPHQSPLSMNGHR